VHHSSVQDVHAQFTEIKITSDFHASGKSVAELALPRAAVIVSVRRGHDLLIPHGDTRLQNGDAVTVLCERQCIDEVKAAFANNNKPAVVGKTY
jgi:Trk K+ transport system NAD-binding subunit